MNYAYNYPLKKIKGIIMTKEQVLTPILKKIDELFFGIEEFNEIEKKSQFIECQNDEEYDVERSTN